MLEMEFIMQDKTLGDSARERRKSKVPNISDQVSLETSRSNSKFATIYKALNGKKKNNCQDVTQ